MGWVETGNDPAGFHRRTWDSAVLSLRTSVRVSIYARHGKQSIGAQPGCICAGCNTKAPIANLEQMSLCDQAPGNTVENTDCMPRIPVALVRLLTCVNEISFYRCFEGWAWIRQRTERNETKWNA
jgi:hypothetical protein